MRKRTLPSTLKLDSGTSCSTGSPVEIAVASAVVPTVAVAAFDVGRRHFEAGSGEAERAEVGHVRSAEAAARAHDERPPPFAKATGGRRREYHAGAERDAVVRESYRPATAAGR